jgi:hypothetical protein
MEPWFYVLIAYRLGRHSDSISMVSRTEGRLDAIVSAVEKQQQLWSFVGYLTLITSGRERRCEARRRGRSASRAGSARRTRRSDRAGA